LLIDIDHFKAYNDRYGHQAGDRCLREVAAAIRAAVRRRPLDVVARYGGEEIIAILVRGDRAAAAGAAGSVLQAVADLKIAPQRLHHTPVRDGECGGEHGRAGRRILP